MNKYAKGWKFYKCRKFNPFILFLLTGGLTDRY